MVAIDGDIIRYIAIYSYMYDFVCGQIKQQEGIIVPVWNVVVTPPGHAEIVYAFQSIEKKVKKGIIVFLWIMLDYASMNRQVLYSGLKFSIP